MGTDLLETLEPTQTSGPNSEAEAWLDVVHADT